MTLLKGTEVLGVGPQHDSGEEHHNAIQNTLQVNFCVISWGRCQVHFSAYRCQTSIAPFVEEIILSSLIYAGDFNRNNWPHVYFYFLILCSVSLIYYAFVKFSGRRYRHILLNFSLSISYFWSFCKWYYLVSKSSLLVNHSSVNFYMMTLLSYNFVN